jgi:TatA/E family protein of Tat protein translocase
MPVRQQARRYVGIPARAGIVIRAFLEFGMSVTGRCCDRSWVADSLARARRGWYVQQAMFGPLELILLIVILLLIFGARRLPSLGRELGSGMREFKEGIVESSSSADSEAEAKRALDAPAERSSTRT